MLDGESHIVRAAIRGEASAFGLLYDHYQPIIYRFVLFKIGRREDAEDLTHQVFLKAWEHIDSYEGRGFPFSSWLYRIARNHVIDHYRAKRETLPIEDFEPILASTQSLSAQTELKLNMQKVREQLRQLKPEYQDVIILRFIEERSVDETAEAMERTPGAVKVLQHRALRELRSLLNESQDALRIKNNGTSRNTQIA